MTLYRKSFVQSLGLISTELWASITSTSGSSHVPGQEENYRIPTGITEDLSRRFLVWRSQLIARSNWRIVEAVLNVRCLPLTERLSLLDLCETGEPLSFYVRPDLTSVWKASTRTLVIGRGVRESFMMESLGERTSIENFLDSEPES